MPTTCEERSWLSNTAVPRTPQHAVDFDYAGWNFGLAQGGWGGLFIATLLMATMYLCMCFSLAELSSMVPTAGGGYGFARTAFGPLGGFLTGTAILIEYAIAPAAIAVFIGAYCESLFGIGGWVIYLAFHIAVCVRPSRLA